MLFTTLSVGTRTRSVLLHHQNSSLVTSWLIGCLTGISDGHHFSRHVPQPESGTSIYMYRPRSCYHLHLCNV
jgi:hypothetical protein